MAFRSNGPTVVALPAFRGVTRRLILIALGVYLATLFVSLFSPGLAALVNSLMLHPDQAVSRYLWQLVTYPFVSLTLFGALLSMLSLWYFGSALEDERGSLWMTEYFLVTTIGGGILACVLSRTVFAHVANLDPTQRTFGLWPFVMALLLAFARFHPEQELTLNFLIRVKAKFLAAIYLLVYVALSLSSHQQFDALTALAASLCGYLYLTLTHRAAGFAMRPQRSGTVSATLTTAASGSRRPRSSRSTWASRAGRPPLLTRSATRRTRRG